MCTEEIRMLKNTRFFKRTMSGRFGRAFWILLSAVLMFAGPSYLEIVLRNGIPSPYLELVSIVLFVIGLYVFLQVFEEK
jgi:hypothetical protein